MIGGKKGVPKFPSLLRTAKLEILGDNLMGLFCKEFDLNEETPSGAGTTHTAHGIIIQETSQINSVPRIYPSVPKTKKTLS